MTKKLASILKEAGALLENRDYTNAAALYQETMKLQPSNAAAAMGIAMIHNRTGQPEEALKILQGVWKAITSSKTKENTLSKAAALAQIGLAQQQLGRLIEALQSFRQANGLFPSAELTKRIQQLEDIIENPRTIEQLLLRASQLYRMGQLDEAVKTYHAALQINADSPEALHGLGLTLRAQKDLDGALPLIQQATILAPDRANYYNDLGMIFQDRGEIEKAVSFHKRALKVDTEFVPAYINLGVAYKRLGRPEEAIAAYRQAITLQPDSAAAHNNLGNLLRIQGDLSGARRELKRAIQLQPGNQDALANLAAIKQKRAIKKPTIPRKIAAKSPATARKATTKPRARKSTKVKAIS